MEDILELFGMIILDIIDVCCAKKPLLRIRFMTGIFSLLAVGFSGFLVWNTVDLFNQGKIIGAVILGVVTFVAAVSSVILIVYLHKKKWPWH